MTNSVLTSGILALAATFCCLAVAAQDTAKPASVTQDGFDVVGISARTNNMAEMGPNGQIPKLWQRLFAENLLNQIPDRTDNSIVVVYTNYASDWMGDYTYILGSKVKAGTKAPSGMVSASVAPGKYDEFVTAMGKGEEVVPATWKQIYEYFQKPGVPARAYKTDFETYAPTDPANVQGHIFIGVK